MDTPAAFDRFLSAFAEEMGRWSARVVTGGIALIAGVALTHFI